MKKLLHGVEIEVDQHPYLPDNALMRVAGDCAALNWRGLGNYTADELEKMASNTLFLVSPRAFARLWPEHIHTTGSFNALPITNENRRYTANDSCECGSDKAKLPTHSTWCPKYGI